MLLKNKNAVIYGGGGSLGGAIARAFAKEGARVFLAGRHMEPLGIVVADIRNAGGFAEAAIVDALNEKAVREYISNIAVKHGSLDISFNAISVEDTQGIPLYEMQLEDFLRPLHIGMRSQFITTSAATLEMIRQGAGVILSLTATPAGMAYPLTGGFGPLCSAVEGFSRNLAAELGPKGIRVLCMRSAGSPDSAVFKKMMANEKNLAKSTVAALANDTMLKRLPLMHEIAGVAVFLASDLSSGMTGTTANITCGTAMD